MNNLQRFQFLREWDNFRAVRVGTPHKLTDETSYECYQKLQRLGTLIKKYHRFCEVACNRALSTGEEIQQDKVEIKIIDLCESMNLTARFNDDPRGNVCVVSDTDSFASYWYLLGRK